jgi:hypothetical protein
VASPASYQDIVFLCLRRRQTSVATTNNRSYTPHRRSVSEPPSLQPQNLLLTSNRKRHYALT